MGTPSDHQVTIAISKRFRNWLPGLALCALGIVYGYFLHRDHLPPYRSIEALCKRWFGLAAR